MKKRKNKIIFTLLVVSLGINIFIVGKWLLFDRWFEPTGEEKIILSEMVQKTVESEDYKSLAENENIIAIEANANKFKGVFPYNFDVGVKTDEQTYLFFCTDDKCTNMANEGWTYSRYEDESPRLPLKEE